MLLGTRSTKCNMKKIALLLVGAILNCSMFAGIPLKNGTQIPVRVTSTISSKKNTTYSAIVDADIKSKGKVLITRGTPVELNVTRRPAGGCGRPGELAVSAAYTRTVDGQSISLQGGNMQTEGDNKRGVAIGCGVGLGVFIWPCIFILCKKGGQAEIPSGTLLPNCFTISEYDINVE